MDKIILASLVLTSLAVFGLPGFLLYTLHRLRMPGVMEAFKVCLLIWVLWIGFVAFILTVDQENKQPVSPPIQAEAASVIALNEGGGFGGKRAQNHKNKRTKRINRKNGIGLLELERRTEA